MGQNIKQPSETHLEKLINSVSRSLEAIKIEPLISLKQIELLALQSKVAKIEKQLEEMAKGGGRS